MDDLEEEERESEIEEEENNEISNYNNNEEEEDDLIIKSAVIFLFRLILAFVLPILALVSITLVIGLLAVMSSNLTDITNPITFPSHCTILSSSVDLRSSKVCELGFLNYKAKNVFYPFHSAIRCRYDYYWASVFQVKYKDHSLGETRLAFAEAPNEALPLDCRPSFRAAWLTKHIFKVNQTYDCWYSVGIPKVSLYRDGFFSCQAKDPSSFEMLRRYAFLSLKTLQSMFVQKKGSSNYWRWETVAGVVTGFSTSLISISFISILHHLKSRLSKTYIARMVAQTSKMVFFRRACFLVAYFSIVVWLVVQYGKRLGLPEISRLYNT